MLVVPFLDGRSAFPGELLQTHLDLPQLVGHHGSLDAYLAGGLVYKVYGFVRHEPVCYIAVGQSGGGLECFVLYLDPVVGLVFVPQATEDLHRLLFRRLVDQDGLEATLQCRVWLYQLAVLVDGRRPDDLQVAPGQGGLEYVPRVHRPLGPPGPGDVVQFVDKEDNPSLGVLNLVYYPLQPLLELASKLRSGHERAQVHGYHASVSQDLGYVALDHLFGQTFDDCGLADAGFPDQDGVVLGSAREDLDHALYLRVEPNDGIELAIPGELRDVTAVLGEHALRVAFGVRFAPPKLAQGAPGRLLGQADLT